jgi:hypothetical protein
LIPGLSLDERGALRMCAERVQIVVEIVAQDRELQEAGQGKGDG